VPEFRDVRASEAIDAFVKAGGIARFGKGSHVNIKMSNGMVITISGHREPVKVGILKAMIKRAGLSESEFLELLGRRR